MTSLQQEYQCDQEQQKQEQQEQEQQGQQEQIEMACVDGDCDGHHCCEDVDCQGNNHGEELTKEMVLLKIKEFEERKKEILRSNEELQKAKNAAFHDISGANMTLSNVEKEEKELKKDKKKNKKELKEKTQEYTKISNDRGNFINELENHEARLKYGKYQVEMINQTLGRLKMFLKYFNGELDESAATEMFAMMDSEEPKKKKKRRKKRKKRKRKSRKVKEEAALAAAEQNKKDLRAKLREKIKGCRSKENPNK